MVKRTAKSDLKAERVQLKAERVQLKVDLKVSSRAISPLLSTVPGWKGKDRRTAITRTYTFPNFRGALAFVAYVGELTEAKDHHPDIDIRYNKVTLTLSTHEAGGLTEKDFELLTDECDNLVSADELALIASEGWTQSSYGYLFIGVILPLCHSEI